MAGKYNGPDFDASGNLTGSWSERVSGRSDKQMAIYRENKAARGGVTLGKPGVAAKPSAPGKAKQKALAKAPSPATTGPGVVQVLHVPSLGVSTPGLTVKSDDVLMPNSPIGRPKTPTRVGTGAGNLSSGPRAGAGPGNLVVGGAWEVGKSTRTPMQVGGVWVSTDTGWSDGGDFEQRYGEFGGAVLGIGVLGADVLKTVNDYVPPFAIDWMGDGAYVTRLGRW